MKSKMKRRMLAIVLCMVIVLSNSSFIFASSESGTPAVEAASTEGTTSQTETDTQVTETTPQTLAVSESTPAPTDESAAPTSVEATPTPTDTPEVTTTPEPTGTPTPEATPTPTDTPETTTTPEPTDAPEITTTPELTDTPEATTTPEPTNTPEATPTPTQGPEDGTSDTAQPTATPTPNEAPVKSNEAVELKQEFKDSDGNVTSTVKAQIPEGTFAADASEITMEVQTPDTASAEHVKEMMEELLPENHMLGDYIFYDIQFKVNGTVTEPQKPITITFEGEELSVKDVKRANVFWLDPEDPQVDGDKDQLVEITQKSEMIENLQNSGQSTENIDDYDLSEITLKEDGTSDKIQMEGRTSTIYGCYVVYEPVQVLTYDDDQVTVTVSAAEEGIIPANAELKVVPITAEDKNTEDQYKEVEQKLQEKAEEDAYDIAGFLAYDITFVDEDGNETEPGGEVKVSIDYKEAAIPETISEEDAANAEVTVFHLEEDEKGEVKEVVDMAQEEKVDVLATTEENKVEKAETRTESFSVFAVAWAKKDYLEISIKDTDGGTYEEKQLDPDNYGDASGADVSEIAKKIAPVGGELSAATIDKASIKNGKIRYNDKEWQYKTSDESWRSWYEIESSDQVVFTYKISKEPYEFSTVETNSEGLKINLFNYNYNIRSTAQANTDYRFIGKWGLDITGKPQATDNEGYGNQNGLAQGLVKRNLENGIPVASREYGNHQENSLAYLFSTKKTNSKTVYSNVTGLFQKTDRWYRYDSRTNHAQLNYNTENNSYNLDVYNQALVSQYDYLSNDDFQTGHFLPFNTIEESQYDDYNRITVDGKQVDLFNVSETMNDTDLWFGMSISGAFYQPKNGQINGSDMVFEFSGDDDVWVYIDDVLLLDIGGIHGRISGRINFAEGKVYVDNENNEISVTFRELFGEAYREENGTLEGFNQYISQILDDNGRFKDYTPHRMNFFYLERGGGASNCMLNFNLPTLPEGSITVQKEIENFTEGAYAGIEFDFELYADLDKDGNCEQITSETEGGKYKSYLVYDADEDITDESKGEKKDLGSDGIFKLKHHEKAVFNGFPPDTKYYVKEVGMTHAEYDDVVIIGSAVTDLVGKKDLTDTTEDGKGYVASDEVVVEEQPYLVFRNHCSMTNLKQLYIQKTLAEGSESAAGESFQMEVKIDGKPYTGKYTVGNSIDSQGNEMDAVDGKITLAADQTAIILGYIYQNGQYGFPSGTRFEVTEGELASKYDDPQYKVENAGDIEISGKAAGTLQREGSNAKVTVTNQIKASEKPENVPHNKTIDYLGDQNPDTELTGEEFYRLYLDVTGIPSVEPEPADIVLVLDYSSSMRHDYGSMSRMDAVKKSAEIAVNTLLPENSKNRVGIVWFDRRADNEEYNLSFKNDKTKLLNNIRNREYDSGTNYQAAFQRTIDMLQDARSDSKKFVIFVTDGEPYQWVDENGDIRDTESSEAKEHAKDEAKNFQGLTGFFAVSVGQEAGKDFLEKDIVGNVSADIKDTLEANNEKELIDAFGKVLSSITKQIGNVTIEDTLTSFVQFVNEKGTEFNADSIEGTQDTLAENNPIALKVTVRDKQSPVSEAQPYSGNYTWKIENNKVTVNFGNDFFLERDKVYTISFNVKVTDQAYEEFNKNGYGNVVGMPGTDYPGNDTSSEKPGFYSNEEATVSYKRVVNGIEVSNETETYDKPVVQVPAQKDWNIIKKGSTDDICLGGAEFTLVSQKDTSVVYKGVSSSDTENKGYVEWTKDDQSVQAKNIDPGTYTLTETKAPTGYCVSAVTWTVIISHTDLPVITPNEAGGAELEFTDQDGDGVYEVTIYNTPVFELPSTGSSGIFGYTMGGTLLLMAGTLILYKMKRKEVQGS